MSIFAIGDLHLSSDGSKSMDKFGWIDHEKRIFQDWQEKVKQEDLIVVAGDISWALKLEDAYTDLAKIAKLPGQKILIKGNHDFWWNSITKLNQFDDKMFFIQNNIYEYDKYVFCGTRGWLCPNENKFDENDQKLYLRETARLKNALTLATQTQKEIVLLLHYPPTNEKKEASNFTKLIEEYQVKTVIYGHLHGKESFYSSLQGQIGFTTYHLVSCDYLHFSIKQIF